MIKISTRIVLVLKNIVIKFPISRRGYLQGKNEKYIWEKYSNTKLLAPFKWEKFGIVCQEKCYDVGTNDFSFQHVELVKNIISEFDIDHCDLYNRKNWGMYNGYIVLLDYGVNEVISKMYKLK
jgi:hypothetical protein